MNITFMIIAMLVTSCSFFIFYCLIVYLVGDFNITNSVILGLVKIRFSKKYQREIIQEMSDILNTEIQKQLNQIIATKNIELMKEIDTSNSDDINKFKDILKKAVQSDSFKVSEETVKKFCDENSVFSFFNNLNEYIKLVPVMPKKTSKVDSQVSDFINKKIEVFKEKIVPTFPKFNVKKLYYVTFN